jgi:hypothetical protein
MSIIVLDCLEVCAFCAAKLPMMVVRQLILHKWAKSQM